MAILESGYNVIIKQKEGNQNKNIYPITPTSNIFNAEGKSLDTIITEIQESKTVNGVPDFSEETVSDLRFLRNDNTWANIQTASTNQAGVVQLSNDVNSSSSTTAPTSFLVFSINQKADDNAANISAIQTELETVVHNTSLGSTNGIATLDDIGKVPASQLPSYVDDVIECTVAEDRLTATVDETPVTPESGKIYVDINTNITFRWSGSRFVEISSSLALGETSSTAFDGFRGKAAYDHSLITHARVDATAVAASETNGNIIINGEETTVYTHPTGETETNPHGTTKEDIGLSNVENKSVAEINKSITSENISNALGYVPNKVDVLQNDPTEDGIYFVVQTTE